MPTETRNITRHWWDSENAKYLPIHNRGPVPSLESRDTG